MKKLFTRTFFRFLFGFMAILAISCSILIFTSKEASGHGGAAALFGL